MNINDNAKYMNLILSLGELLHNKDERIQFNESEIDILKKRIKKLEEQIEYYQQPDELCS